MSGRWDTTTPANEICRTQTRRLKKKKRKKEKKRKKDIGGCNYFGVVTGKQGFGWNDPSFGAYRLQEQVNLYKPLTSSENL
jgi:hypothetical protein